MLSQGHLAIKSIRASERLKIISYQRTKVIQQEPNTLNHKAGFWKPAPDDVQRSLKSSLHVISIFLATIPGTIYSMQIDSSYC